MKTARPLPLVIGTVLYLGYLCWNLVTVPDWTVAGRLALSCALFFFVWRGSRTAANILAVLCLMSGLVLLVAGVATYKQNVLAAVNFLVMAAFLFAFMAYLVFSPAMRRFWQKRPVAQAGVA